MATIEVAIDLETITCYLGTCGITFAVPTHWLRTKRRDHSDFTCPNAHPQAFLQKSREEELRDQLAQARQMTDYQRERANHLEDRNTNLKNSNRALRGVATKLKKRIAAGTCPFCEHQFPDVASHVEAEHPAELAQATAEADDPQSAEAES